MKSTLTRAALATTGLALSLVSTTSAEACPGSGYTTAGDAADQAIASYQSQVTGLCVVARAGGVTAKRCAGEKKKGFGVAPDTSTLFQIGSVTKNFVGTLLALRVYEGTAHLDDALAGYLPASYPVNSLVTLKKLATHTSGLQRTPGPYTPGSLLDTYADVYRCVNVIGAPCWDLSTAPLYSNYAFLVLADALADHITGLPWPEVNANDIMHDLDMPNTLTYQQYWDGGLMGYFNAHKAFGHSLDSGGSVVSQPPLWVDHWSAGAGGLYSSTDDMAKWLEYNMGIIGTTKLRNSLPTIRSELLGWGATSPAKCVATGSFYNKNGSLAGFNSFIGYDSVGGRGVVVLVNDDPDIGQTATTIGNDLMMHLP